MKNLLIVLSLVAGAVINAGPVYAHIVKAKPGEEIVPIPPYSAIYGEAGAQSALKAAYALLETFADDQEKAIALGVDAGIRSKWSNLPAAFVERGGTKVGDMSPAQRKTLFNFLSSALSPAGYRKVADIMAAEAFLSTDRRAERLMWSPKNYWFAFYGTPDVDGAWGWQFGGHHLAINMAYANGRIVSMSPAFLGTEPAVFTLDGIRYEVIVDLHQAGEAVFEALNAEQKAAARYPTVPEDILTGPGKDGFIPAATGLQGAELTVDQKRLLLRAIEGWVLVQPNINANARMKEIEAGLTETYFTWIDTSEINTPSYFRIQGPDLIIELLSTGGNVGENAQGLGHYHTIYRRPSREYGLSQ